MTRETMIKLKRGDTVYVACKVDAVFVEGGLIQVSTRDCDDGFDAYVDEVLEQEPCEDAVSRQQAISSIRNLYPGIPFVKTELNLKKWQEKNKKYFECENIIKALPSVTPTRKKGKWERGYSFPDGEYVKCTVCGEIIKCIYPMHYCPNCGAEMESKDGND